MADGAETTRPVVVVAYGLQRSGNHAILGWVESLFPRCVFHNDERHALFADPQATAARLADRAPCTIVSFEDSANRTARPGTLLADGPAPLPGTAAAGRDIHRLAILRDPYNTWASRVAANARAAEFGRPLTSDPSWQLFRDNWLAMAALAGRPGWRAVLFNRWRDEAAYRRALCAELGGSYSEATLDAVSHRGGGSSFEGVPRPSYAAMLRQWPKYASGPFLRRLAAKPGHYLRRAVRAPQTGRAMAVERRWETLVGRPEGAALFADADLAEATERLFGAAAVPPGAGRRPD